jgi:hypothetical protein
MNREQLLAAMDQLAVEKPRAVHIKGLGDIHIREITVGEIDDQIADNADKKNKRAVARGACRLLCDEDGNRLLDPEDPEDVARMAKQPLRVLVAINKAAEDEPGN